MAEQTVTEIAEQQIATHGQVYIIYPDRRWLTIGRVKTIFFDALANGKLHLEAQEITNGETALMVEALHNAGEITLARPSGSTSTPISGEEDLAYLDEDDGLLSEEEDDEDYLGGESYDDN